MFSVVRCSFIYPCWTGTACCSLLTWAETKWVRQLIIHGAIISRINIMMTGTIGALANSKFPIARRVPQREMVATPGTLQLILWGPVGSRTEKAMATHSSTLAWKIPWMEEPGRLQSMGSLRVGHNWATSVSLFTFMHWRRKWQPTPMFLPGVSQGRWSPVGCHLCNCTESATTELT